MLNREDYQDVKRKMGSSEAKKVRAATRDRGASNDRRYNAEKHVPGVKPGKHSEYFGKSYSELQRESKKVRTAEAKTSAIKKRSSDWRVRGITDTRSGKSRIDVEHLKGSGYGESPVHYGGGKMGYDRPESIPKSVKSRVSRLAKKSGL